MAMVKLAYVSMLFLFLFPNYNLLHQDNSLLFVRAQQLEGGGWRLNGTKVKSSKGLRCQSNFCTVGLDHEQLAGLRRDRLCHNRSGTQTQGGASFNFYTLVTSFEIRGSAASSCRSRQPGSVWERRRRNLGSGAPPLPTSSLRWDQTLPEA